MPPLSFLGHGVPHRLVKGRSAWSPAQALPLFGQPAPAISDGQTRLPNPCRLLHPPPFAGPWRASKFVFFFVFLAFFFYSFFLFLILALAPCAGPWRASKFFFFFVFLAFFFLFFFSFLNSCPSPLCRAMACLKIFRFEQAEEDCNRALRFDLKEADKVGRRRGLGDMQCCYLRPG